MGHRRSEVEIARGLCSSDQVERDRAVGAFVRLFTFWAPTGLALLATRSPQVCAAYQGDRPLAQHLLESLELSDEVSLAWRIALLTGPELSQAAQRFEQDIGGRLRGSLRVLGQAGEDAHQAVMLKVLAEPRFRRTCFGSYSGRGSLTGYLRTVFIREAIRSRRQDEDRDAVQDELERQLETREPRPGERAARRELQEALCRVLSELSQEPGMTAFLLQQGFEMSPGDVARTLDLNETAVRQRTFRFRAKFRQTWRRLFPDDPEPLA